MNINKINNQILDIKKKISYKEELIDNFQSDESKNDITKSLKEDLLNLRRKLNILEKQKINGKFIPKKPELGDQKYKNSGLKNAFDILRVMYFEQFGIDPSINFINEGPIFGDDTLPILGYFSQVRGEFPFKLILEDDYINYEANKNYNVGIMFKTENLRKQNKAEYLNFIKELIKRYTGKDVNFIYSDGYFNNLSIIYLSDIFFKNHTYYEFFSLLFDNLERNIIYVGDDIKQKGTIEEIKYVDSKIIIPSLKRITEDIGLSEDNIQMENDKVKKYFI